MGVLLRTTEYCWTNLNMGEPQPLIIVLHYN